jgi:hypothetical protein
MPSGNWLVLATIVGIWALWSQSPDPALYWSGVVIIVAGLMGAAVVGHRLLAATPLGQAVQMLAWLHVAPTPVGWVFLLASVLGFATAIGAYLAVALVLWSFHLRGPNWPLTRGLAAALYWPLFFPVTLGAFWIRWDG